MKVGTANTLELTWFIERGSSPEKIKINLKRFNNLKLIIY